jgi:hypothetical protein
MSLALALCKEEGKENAPAEQTTVLQAAQAALVIKTPFA